MLFSWYQVCKVCTLNNVHIEAKLLFLKKKLRTIHSTDIDWALAMVLTVDETQEMEKQAGET